MVATYIQHTSELCWLNPMRNQSPPSVEEVKRALEANGFDPKIAQSIPWGTALRRAVSHMENREIKATFKEKGSVLWAQLDRVEVEEQKIERECIAVWKLEGEGKGDDRTYTLTRLLGVEELDPRLAVWRAQYTWADVTQIILKVIRIYGQGAYPTKDNGGHYFVPVTNADLIANLNAACEQVNLNFLHLTVPSEEKYHEQVEEAIGNAMRSEVEIHLAAIAEYNEETRRKIVENRQEAIQKTRELVDSLRSHLRSSHSVLVHDLEECARRNAAAMVAIDAYRPQPSVGGRRVVPMGRR